MIALGVLYTHLLPTVIDFKGFHIKPRDTKDTRQAGCSDTRSFEYIKRTDGNRIGSTSQKLNKLHFSRSLNIYTLNRTWLNTVRLGLNDGNQKPTAIPNVKQCLGVRSSGTRSNISSCRMHTEVVRSTS